MKTLIINGSPRKSGDTVSLINEVMKSLNGEVKIINAYFSNIKPCVDCRYCKENKGCAIKDGMTEIYDYIECCDNILIASPMYFSELTGELLNVASRIQTFFSAKYFRGETSIKKQKRGAVILVGGGDGNINKPYDTAKCILKLLNAKDILPPVISHNTDKMPASEDEKALSEARGISDFFNDDKR